MSTEREWEAEVQVKYELTTRYRALLIAVPILVSVCALAPAWHGGPQEVLVIGAIVACLAWWGYLSVPYSVELKEDDSAEFRSLLGRRVVRLADVQRVNAGRWNRGFVTVRSGGTVVNLFGTMPGVDALLHGIQRCNPTVSIERRR
jgi:hypothetical protein